MGSSREERWLQRLGVPRDKLLSWRSWPFALQHAAWWRPASLASFVLAGLVVKSAHLWGVKRSTLYGKEHLPLLEGTRDGRPLITISNHVSTLDDPGMWGFLRLSHMWQPSRQRWTLIANDICCTKLRHSLFFAISQGIPVMRGAGVYQHGMTFALEKLDAGRWIHVFPEGKVNQSGVDLPFKWGVGRLVMDAKVTPLVVPIHIRGLETVKKLKNPTITLAGKELSAYIGAPLDLSDEVQRLKQYYGVNAVPVRKHLTDVMEEALAVAKAAHMEALQSGEMSKSRGRMAA